MILVPKYQHRSLGRHICIPVCGLQSTIRLYTLCTEQRMPCTPDRICYFLRSQHALLFLTCFRRKLLGSSKPLSARSEGGESPMRAGAKIWPSLEAAEVQRWRLKSGWCRFVGKVIVGDRPLPQDSRRPSFVIDTRDTFGLIRGILHFF